MSVPEAVAFGKRYVIEAVRHSYPLGAGHGPISPLWTVRRWWEDPQPTG
jgi:hydroxymethylpyrimidine/phosphomethylpyrimidine kinase